MNGFFELYGEREGSARTFAVLLADGGPAPAAAIPPTFWESLRGRLLGRTLMYLIADVGPAYSDDKTRRGLIVLPLFQPPFIRTRSTVLRSTVERFPAAP